jgi:hypothetical protein
MPITLYLAGLSVDILTISIPWSPEILLEAVQTWKYDQRVCKIGRPQWKYSFLSFFADMPSTLVQPNPAAE